MVASTTTTNRAAETFPVSTARSGGGDMKVAYGSHTFAAADDEAGDIFQMCRIPGGARVIGGWVQGIDLDSNATETLDFNVGWAANGTEIADADGFGNFGVVTGDAVASIKPEVGIYMPLGGQLFVATQTFSAETIIELSIVAAAATLNVGELHVVVLYVENDGTI